MSRPNDLATQFGPLVPASQPPHRDTLLNLERLRDECERLRDEHQRTLNRQLESELRAVQMGIRSLLRDLQRFPDDHARLAVELSALLNYRPAPPSTDRIGKPVISLQENLEAIGGLNEEY